MQPNKKPIISLATGDIVAERAPSEPPAATPIRKVPIPEKFQDLFAPLRDAHRMIEMKVVAAKFRDALHVLGGEVRFIDTPIAQWKQWSQCFENEEVAVLHDVTVLSDWDSILDSLASGELDFKGRKVVLRHPPSGDPSVTPHPSATEPKSRGPGGVIADESVGLAWILCMPEEEFTAPWCERMERKLTKKTFDSLQELLAQFIPGHVGGRGRVRRLDVVVPLPFTVTMKSSGGSVSVQAWTSGNVKPEEVGFALKFIQGNDWDGKTLGSEPLPIRAWQSSEGSFYAEETRKIPTCDSVQLSISYRGERITKTSLGVTQVAQGIPAWHKSSEASEALPADADDFVNGKERAITFLDLDVAGHTELLKLDGKRTAAALEELHRIFERAVKSKGGRLNWLGDGGTAFFVGGGRSERAARAAMRTLLDSQEAFVAAPEKLMDLPLRAALDWGSTAWFDDTSGIHCDALNWAAHAQKSAGAAPRLSVSDEVSREMSPELQRAFVAAGEFEERAFWNWRFLASGAAHGAAGQETRGNRDRALSMRATRGKAMALEVDPQSAEILFWIPVTVHNPDANPNGLEDLRLEGVLTHSENGVPRSVKFDRHVLRLTHVGRVTPATELRLPGTLPCRIEARESERFLFAFEASKTEWDALGGSTAGVFSFDGEIESEDSYGGLRASKVQFTTHP